MAKSRTFTVHAESEVLAQLAEAIACYAKAAYPPGGSECAQVASDTLLSTARLIFAAQRDGSVPLRTRQRQMLIAAVDWYCKTMPELSEERCQMLTGLLKRSA